MGVTRRIPPKSVVAGAILGSSPTIVSTLARTRPGARLLLLSCAKFYTTSFILREKFIMVN